MAKKRPRRLVVDADVAFSASESEHPISSTCREFLDTMLKVGHHVVMTDEIKKEWDRHNKIYFRKWLIQMWSRKRVDRVGEERNDNLRKKINKVIISRQKPVVEKDIHLIEAAIATDRLLTSRDETARRAFGNVSAIVGELRQIVWVNPTQNDENPINWLQDGAKADADRRLGA